MAGEIQLNSTTMATESSGSITAELDTIRPNTTNGSLTLQGDSSNAGVTGLTIDSSGVVNTTTAKVTNIQATSGQSLTIKDEDGNAAITIGTDNTAASYLSLNFGSYHGGSGTLSGSTLNDYETGTWSPSITADGGAGNASSSGSFSTIGGNYTKIGNMVFLEAQINLGTKTAVSSYLGIANVPFAADASYRSFAADNYEMPTVLSRRNDSGGIISNGRLGSTGAINLNGLTAGQGGEFSFTMYFRTT